ncbi:hypothetical protein CVS40_1646 [Lucilia cuprina]|nr:hypothetical protein CVS40_1646 [Lucilia cuprina]
MPQTQYENKDLTAACYKSKTQRLQRKQKNTATIKFHSWLITLLIMITQYFTLRNVKIRQVICTTATTHKTARNHNILSAAGISGVSSCSSNHL